MRLFIEPTEPLLFRTGRPFTAGENSFADSLFPPTPETLQGAVRAMIAMHWSRAELGRLATFNELFQPNSKLVQLIGSRATYGHFRITGFTLGRRDPTTGAVERLFPAPSNYVELTFKGEQDKSIVRLRPEEREERTAILSNLPQAMRLLQSGLDGRQIQGKTEPLHGWVTDQGLRKALSRDQKLEKKDFIPADKVFEKEPRLGIGMQNTTKTTQEGFLYQVNMIRMQPDFGFVVDIRLSESAEGGKTDTPSSERFIDDIQARRMLGLSSSNKGWLIIGGEQRAASFEIIDVPPSQEDMSIEQMKAGRLLYLATPSYFKGGWQPEDKNNLPSAPVAAAIHHYQVIGGWYLDPDNAGGEAKYARRCVPAGSVYFFEEPVTIPHPLTDYGWQIGYGIAYVGEW